MNLIVKTTKEILDALPDLRDDAKEKMAEKAIDGWILFNNLGVDRLQEKYELDLITANYIVEMLTPYASFDIFPEKFALPPDEALEPHFENKEDWVKQAKEVADWIAAHGDAELEKDE
ncbi:hypothetical protein Y032_0151g2791 [Ancylostoma ceylanicum]|uniref:Uncharacterized protein n=2 Tax=Ancylostoma ceylanicum TaxID=53326 RepID=A0A016T129_9BILA|nr:hypothetical protein Y032_0151g2791 [Ancylostoma ceylanicum]